VKKRRRSRRQVLGDIVWMIVVGGLAIGGVFICAYYQGGIRGGGMRLALIVAALGIGGGAGFVIDRVTASRRSSHSSGANRKTRRHIRTVTYSITGIVSASWVIAWYMANQLWLIVGAAAAVLAATWLWYIVENRLLSRGKSPGRLDDRDY